MEPLCKTNNVVKYGFFDLLFRVLRLFTYCYPGHCFKKICFSQNSAECKTLGDVAFQWQHLLSTDNQRSREAKVTNEFWGQCPPKLAVIKIRCHSWNGLVKFTSAINLVLVSLFWFRRRTKDHIVVCYWVAKSVICFFQNLVDFRHTGSFCCLIHFFTSWWVWYSSTHSLQTILSNPFFLSNSVQLILLPIFPTLYFL